MDMFIEVFVGLFLVEVLVSVILLKFVEVGWGIGGDEDGVFVEYIVFMVFNGKI